MFAVLTAALAFHLPQKLDRRAAAGAGLAAAVLGIPAVPAFADGAASAQTALKAKAKYGQRVLQLADASAAECACATRHTPTPCALPLVTSFPLSARPSPLARLPAMKRPLLPPLLPLQHPR